jgi:alpha-beta hydrolase superfamily lysophospholipase
MTITAVFILINVIAFFHSYRFTHFEDNALEKTKEPKSMSSYGKAKTLLLGVDNPRPVNITKPRQSFQTIKLKSNKEIECWSIQVPHARGTVILFHGFTGEKSSQLDKSDEFVALGYNTLLVDFMGSGGSEGNETTIGFMEAEQVKTCFEYIRQRGDKHIYLYGTSMGAVAVMKAVYDFHITPTAIVAECPFGSMYETVCARFKNMHVPTIPMAGLLVFWGGVQHGFWGFGHNPSTYAKKVKCPTLLLYGERDEKVSRAEIDEIFINLNGPKQLRTYPQAGHESYLLQYKDQWRNDITQFLTAS